MKYSPATLVRLAGDGMIGLYRHSANFETRLTPQTWLIASGAGHSLLNWIGVFEPGPAAETAFREAVSTLRSRGLPALTFITPNAHAAIEPIAQSLGLGESWPVPLLLVELSPLPEPPLVAGLDIFEIRDEQELKKAVALAARAFEMPLDAALEGMTAGSLEEPSTHFYAAARNGETLGMTALIQFGSLVYIDLMATSPEHQRQGIGLALLTKVLNDHAAAGVTHAFLISSQEGRPLYTRLGFEHVFDGTMYHVEPTST